MLPLLSESLEIDKTTGECRAVGMLTEDCMPFIFQIAKSNNKQHYIKEDNYRKE